MHSTNILLVAGSASFSTRDVWDGYRVALGDAGLNVIPYSTFSFLNLLSVDAVCNDIIGTAVDQTNRIDYAIFVDGLYFRGARSRVPQSIRRAGIPTVLIATEDPYTTIPNTESLYTHRFTNEKTCAVKGVEYLPTATLVPPSPGRNPDPKYDVSFLGTVFEDRAPTLLRIAEHCEQNKLRMLVAGKILGDATVFDRFRFVDTKFQTINEAHKWQIYSDSAVTLNIFRESDEAVSPSPRIFETTAFGHAALISGPRRDEVISTFGESIYHFDTAEEAIDAIDQSLAEKAEREAKAEAAKQITVTSETYHHRARSLMEMIREGEIKSPGPRSSAALDSKTAWIIGCGRTGSTWLAEMLGDMPKIRRWHEPYFGRLFRHLSERPDELNRNSAFFAKRQQQVWLKGLRDLFYSVAQDRFPQLGGHSLVIKEVNTPEIYGWIHAVFPQSHLILLARDPFDVLDSYLDLQQPGSWNQRFGESDDPLDGDNVRRTANHIAKAMTAAIDAFDAFPESQRLWLQYENLLENADDCLAKCAELLGHEIAKQKILQVVEQHRFENYKKTGKLEFRRHGRAHGWTESDNFNGEVQQIANTVLGDLRLRLGYRAQVR